MQKKLLTAALCALVLGGSSLTAVAGIGAPFSYFANGSDLERVLDGFARSQGMRATFDSTLDGKVSGRFQKTPARDFLSAMDEAYGVGYYVLGNTLHFYSRNDLRKDFLTVPSGSTEDLVRSLERSGVLAEELPVEVNAEGNMLTLIGTEAYLQQLRVAAQAYLAVQSEKIVMRVFPIHHAWADDITLTNMDRTVTVPGIATILRGMVMGQAVSGTTVSQSEPRAQSVPSLGVEGLSRQGEHKPKSAEAPRESPVAQGSISIIADPRVNAVLVSDAAYRMPYYEKVIADLDKPVELVEIHAAIVDVDTDASKELGINFRGRGGDNWRGGGSVGGGSSGDGSSDVPIELSGGGALLSTIYRHGSAYFEASINALESKNAARMLGRPSVLTVDNVEAVLENTTTYYIPLRGTEAVDLYKVESGTVLRVTPHIVKENGKTAIKLAVSVQDDQSDTGAGYQTIGGENSDAITVNPIKQTRINTQAMVDVGQSLLIGGYYYEQRSEGDSGVPILKDIPILGHLFQSSDKKSRQMERLILLTPRIVTADETNVPGRVNDGRFRRDATGASYDLRPASGLKYESPVDASSSVSGALQFSVESGNLVIKGATR